MLKTILVPLDGSALSERAVHYAEVLGRSVGTQLVFMRGVPMERDLSPNALDHNRVLTHRAQDYLAGFVEQARATGLTAESVVWGEEAAGAIGKAAETKDADLIVMSTHGRGGMARMVWGSVADRVLHRTAVPILLVPRDTSTRWITDSGFKVLLPLDGSALAEQAIGPARDLAQALGAGIVLVQALDSAAWITSEETWGAYSAEIDKAVKRHARAYLAGVAQPLAAAGFEVLLHLAEGSAPSVIRAAAREHQAAAIIMATHGRGGVSRLVMGSVADAVLRTARLPLLIARPAAVRLEHAAAASEARPAASGRLIPLSMSAEELELTKLALRQLLKDHEGKGDGLGQNLLARLEQIEEWTAVSGTGAAWRSGDN